MTRKKLFLCGACLLSSVTFVTYAWTQPPQQNEPTINRPGGGGTETPSSDGRSGRELPGTSPTFSSAKFFGGRAGMPPGMMIGGEGTMSEPGGRFEGPMRARTVVETVHRIIHEPVPTEEIEQYRAFQKAHQWLKDAKEDGDKKKASDAIKEQLVTQFDRDLVQREQELASVEERLKSLRQQLDKRKVSKDDIITLRLKTIINNAEGLGFPGADAVQEGTLDTQSQGFLPLPMSRNASSADGFNLVPNLDPTNRRPGPDWPKHPARRDDVRKH